MKHNQTHIGNLLEPYRKAISRCVRCGSCKAVCPSFLLTQRESFSPRGRMALIEAALDKKLPFSGIFRERLATCTGCAACEAACASGVPVTEVIQAAKEQAVREAGAGLIESAVSSALKHEGIMKSLAWLAPVVLRYAGLSVRGRGRGKTVRGTERRRDRATRTMGRVVFFPGCAIRHFQRDVGQAVISVLSALGYDVLVPHELACCGRPLLSLGDRKAAEELAAQNSSLLSSFNADAVVTACASCGLTFKKEYPTLLAPSGRTPVPVLDIHEFLAGKISGLDLKPLNMRLTWHDPCHLGRGQGLSRTAREVLCSVPGIELVEMRDPDRCCGFGGVMRIIHPAVSAGIGDEKAKSILETQASVVVTGCPGCRMQIADSLRRSGPHVEVVHTAQVLEAALQNADCGITRRDFDELSRVAHDGEQSRTMRIAELEMTGPGVKGPGSGI